MDAECCRYFWRNLVPRWIKAGLGKMKKDTLSSVIERLKERGWKGGGLETWTPDLNEAHMLKEALTLLGYIENPVMAEQNRLDYYRRFRERLGRIKRHGPALIEIADCYIFSRLGRKFEPLGLSLPDDLPVRKRVPSKKAKKTPPNLPQKKGRKKADPHAVSFVNASRLSYPNARESRIEKREVPIYRDEVVVVSEFVEIAGVVWAGPSPVEKTLASAVLRTLIPDNHENMPLRMRLTLMGLDLQEANLDGDPLRIEDVSPFYERDRKKGLECNRELVAYVDANIAVYYADTFDFAQAKAVMERAVSDPYFGELVLSAQGRAWSGLGQYHSIEKNYEQAEHLFQKAIDAFQKDPGLKEEKRQGEIDRTSVYRAINAMDGRFPNSGDLVQQVLGDVVSAAKTLASSSLQPYHHHLLLRSFYDLQSEDALPKDLPGPFLEAQNSYLRLHAQWKSAERHPWPLIEMYRGILWWKQGNPVESKKRFYQAIDVATTINHGHVLRLIAAMISAVGFCCHQADIWRGAAEKFMEKVEEGLPKTKDAVRKLGQAMDYPGEEGIRQALGALPFNYH